MNIAEEDGVGKVAGPGDIPKHYLYAGILALACSASFGLGLMEGKEQGGGAEVSITQLATSTPEFLGAAVGLAQAAPDTMPAGGQVVAAKTGTKYYFPWCGTVKRIKEENKVWFASAAEAEAAGYEPASNCKGM